MKKAMSKIILIALFITPFLSFAQAIEKENVKKGNRTTAIRQIKEIHDGALFIRLKTKKKTLAAMRKSGREELAKKTEDKLLIRNKKIAATFKEVFDFCPVYFFYSDDSKYIKKQQLDSVTFLNYNLLPTKVVHSQNTTIYVAEFSSTDIGNNASQVSVTGLVILQFLLYFYLFDDLTN